MNTLDFYLMLTESFSKDLDKYIAIAKKIVLVLIWKTIDFLSFISRPLYILLLIIGVIAYAIPVNSYKSKKIIWGGILLMLFTEFILPLIKSNIVPPS